MWLECHSSSIWHLYSFKLNGNSHPPSNTVPFSGAHNCSPTITVPLAKIEFRSDRFAVVPNPVEKGNIPHGHIVRRTSYIHAIHWHLYYLCAILCAKWGNNWFNIPKIRSSTEIRTVNTGDIQSNCCRLKWPKKATWNANRNENNNQNIVYQVESEALNFIIRNNGRWIDADQYIKIRLVCLAVRDSADRLKVSIELSRNWECVRQSGEREELPETRDLIRAMPLTVAAQMCTANSWILNYNFVRKILLDSGKIPIWYCDVVLRLSIDYRIIQ